MLRDTCVQDVNERMKVLQEGSWGQVLLLASGLLSWHKLAFPENL